LKQKDETSARTRERRSFARGKTGGNTNILWKMNSAKNAEGCRKKKIHKHAKVNSSKTKELVVPKKKHAGQRQMGGWARMRF